MCGIAGWLSWTEPPDAAVVARMCDALAHRGPDAAGLEDLGPLVLGHRRLSVIDVAERSNQPMFDHARRYAIAYNGELYNYRELRRELEADGARFLTASDTEVVLEAYKAWGSACLERFNGMFALALWDIARRCLFLARDRAGEKPLYYAPFPGGGLAFASEPGALLLHPGVSRGVDPLALNQYLAFNYTLGESCMARGVRRLPPAHFMLAGAGTGLAPRRYWDLAGAFREKRRFVSEDEAAEALGALIDDAVRLRMVSDVPLGAFLSGGIDSATVVAAMTRQGEASRVRTFTVGFDETGFDEVPAARRVAGFLGVDHSDATLHPLSDELRAALAAAAAEPLADSSSLPTWLLSRFARQRVTVALSGDGGDECFAGYPTYAADRLRRMLGWMPRWCARGMQRSAERLLPASFSKVGYDEKLRRFAAGFALDAQRAHCTWRIIFDAEERAALLRPDAATALQGGEADPFAPFDSHFAEVSDCDFLDQAMYVDIKTWLPDDILAKVDRASMAHSLEVRAPLLDHRLMEFAASLPVAWKMRGLRGKRLLRLAQTARLPRETVQAGKRGFNAPVSHWLGGPLLDFAREALGQRLVQEWIEPRAMERLLNEHASRRRDHGLKLLGLIGFALWLQDSQNPQGRYPC